MQSLKDTNKRSSRLRGLAVLWFCSFVFRHSLADRMLDHRFHFVIQRFFFHEIRHNVTDLQAQEFIHRNQPSRTAHLLHITKHCRSLQERHPLQRVFGVVACIQSLFQQNRNLLPIAALTGQISLLIKIAPAMFRLIANHNCRRSWKFAFRFYIFQP